MVLTVVVLVLSAVMILWSLNLRFKRRELQHKERLIALEKGVTLVEPPRQTAPWSPQVYLLRGLIWLFSGIAITVAIFAISQTARKNTSPEVKLWRAATLRHQGATEDEVKMFLNSPQTYDSDIPAGLALLGLIPAGVGLAYLLFYRAEGRKLLS